MQTNTAATISALNSLAVDPTAWDAVTVNGESVTVCRVGADLFQVSSIYGLDGEVSAAELVAWFS